MIVDKILWCAKKKDGIELIKPNQNLAAAYIKKAEDSLKTMREIDTKDWKISTAYYAMYFSLYSILMKIGVKCSIHSCTIEVAKRFLKDYFSKEEIDFLKDSMKARIDAQYYINREVEEEQFREMIKRAPKFLVKSKNVVSKISEKEVSKIKSYINRKLFK